MTPHAASIERVRGNLRALLNSGSADHNRIGFLVGIIVGLHICAGEMNVKLGKRRPLCP